MKKFVYMIISIVLIFSLSGCSLLKLPGAIIGGVLGVVKETANAAKGIPWWLWL